MGGRQRVRPYYGHHFMVMFNGDAVGEGIIFGSGYARSREKIVSRDNSLQVIAVVAKGGVVDFISPYTTETLEQDILRRDVVIGDLVHPDDAEHLSLVRRHLKVAVEGLWNKFSSIELAVGYAKLLEKMACNVEKSVEGTEKEESKMSSKVSTVFNRVKDDTIKSAKAAGKLEFVGRTGLTVAKQEFKALLPMIPEEVIDHPTGDILVSVLALTLIASFAPDNKYAGAAAEAMSTVAFQNGMAKLKVPELVSKLVSGIGIEQIKALMEEEDKDALP